MASAGNFHSIRNRATPIGTAKTAAATLTQAEVENAVVRVDSNDSGFTVTIPAAADKYKGVTLLVANTTGGTTAGNDCFAYVAAGYGGASTNYDNVTVGIGEFANFWCDGSYWYGGSAVVPG